MGNYKFRLSQMIPNAWFYKLREMAKPKESIVSTAKKKNRHPNQNPLSSNNSLCRKSYYFTREFQPTDKHGEEEPSKPEKKKTRRSTARSPKRVAPAVSGACSCRSTINLKEESAPLRELFPPESRADGLLVTQSPHQIQSDPSILCDLNPSLEVIIRVDSESLTHRKPQCPLNSGCDSPEPKLSPIATKQVKKKKKKKIKSGLREGEEQHRVGSTLSPGARRYYLTSAGIKLRTHSPRLSGRRSFHYGQTTTSGSSRSSSSGSRRSISANSLAIVKSSYNPQGDFRESMLEMIAENKLSTSKDLEDLLACYLSLNSDEYHGLIIKVFKQIWLDLSDVKMK